MGVATRLSLQLALKADLGKERALLELNPAITSVTRVLFDTWKPMTLERGFTKEFLGKIFITLAAAIL